jgi:hypothetical protein
MIHRIDFTWCQQDGGKRYAVSTSYRGETVSTTVEAADVPDQRQRQEVEQRLATLLAASLDLPDALGPLR